MENQEMPDNGKKIIFWVIIGIVLLVLALFFCKMWKEKKKQEKRMQNNTNNQSQTQEVKPEDIQLNNPISRTLPGYEERTDNFPLTKGSVGKRVEQLQIFLLKNWGFQGKIDGKFGDETKAFAKSRLGVEEISENLFDRYNLSTVKTIKYN